MQTEMLLLLIWHSLYRNLHWICPIVPVVIIAKTEILAYCDVFKISVECLWFVLLFPNIITPINPDLSLLLILHKSHVRALCF